MTKLASNRTAGVRNGFAPRRYLRSQRPGVGAEARQHHPLVMKLFGADLRSLAALRIVLALIVLADVIARARNLRVHYTDAGVLRREVVVGEMNPWSWSLSLINGTAAFQTFLFGLAIVAALGMLVGFRTRLMTIAVWVLIISIQARNPMVLSAADSLLRLLLFWSIFLPLGAWWSVDRYRRPPSQYRSMQVLSVATVGLFMQIAIMYWFTALLKTGDEWRRSGTALYYAFSAQHLTHDLGEYLSQFEAFLKVLTFVTLGLEMVAPALLFFPIFTPQIRTAAVACIMGFQLGIVLTLDLGIFPWTSALCMVCFLPAWFWDRIAPQAERLMHRSPARRRFATTLAVGRTLLRTTAHDVGRWWSPNGRSGAIPNHNGNGASGKEAATATRGEGTSGTPVILRTSPIVNVFAACCLVLVLGWNVASVSGFSMPQASRPVVYGLGLHQRWNMFAPRPPRATIWYVYHGTLVDGTDLDLLPTIVNGDLAGVQPLSWEEPDDISGNLYGDKYWRKYLDEVAASGSSDERKAFAGYICRTWNGQYGEDVALDTIDMVRLRRSTLPENQDAPIERSVIAQYHCT